MKEEEEKRRPKIEHKGEEAEAMDTRERNVDEK
jgi:hypothetical protein